MDGYHVVESDGSYGGMDVEYMRAIQQYTTWDVKYVYCHSWDDALEMLKNKEVDLVGSAQYSEARAEIYDYAELSSGYTFGVIATTADNDVAYEDFHMMKEFTFGVVGNYVRKAEFLEYLKTNGITEPTIKEYSTTAELHKALEEGEVDAYAHTFTEVKEGQRLIGRFAPRPFYYITYKGNEGLLDELNQAIVDLKMNQPELETELMNKFYYDRFDQAILLSTSEKEYLEAKQVIRVGYVDNYYPFSYVEDGEFIGLTKELIESSLSITGLDIEYVCLESRQEARSALMNGRIDIFAYSTDRDSILKEYNLKSICDYVQVPLVLVTEKNSPIENIKKIGTVSFLEDTVLEYVDANAMELVTYVDQQACIDAVMNGEVDAIICNGYYIEHLMRTNVDYNNIQIKSVLNLYYSISIAISNDQKILSEILEKTVETIDSQMINEYMLKDVTYPVITFITFLRNHTLTLLSVLASIFIVIVFVILHMLKDSQKIQQLMYKDEKKDIWNVNYFTYWGEKKLLASGRNKYAVVHLTFNNFHRFSVIYGHKLADNVIDLLMMALKLYVNSENEIYAINQEERFLLLLNYKDEESLYSRLSEMKQAVESELRYISGDDLTIKYGIYLVPFKEVDLTLAINKANEALEFGDEKAGSGIRVYDESIQTILQERHRREQLLEDVDTDKDFVAFYQPKVDVREDKIVGAEALVRFKDPSDGGKIKAPYFFVPYYEQTGRITEIDFFVYESVCKMLRRRIDAGLPVVTVSCNFSRMHFVNEGFVYRFEEILNKYNIDKSLIEVEVTETLVMEEISQGTVMANFDSLKQRGIHLSIDDFGAGYSSLGVFEQIPASVVKMDRSFFLNKDNHERQVKIMRGIVNLSNELNAKVVCEGVETQKDVDLMGEIGAYIAQGYFYSKPISEEEFEALLNDGYIRRQNL